VCCNQFIGLDVHHNGFWCNATSTDPSYKLGLCHGMYVDSSHNLIEGCRLSYNAGWGIQLFRHANNNTLRRCLAAFNGQLGPRGPGIGVYSGVGHRVEGCVSHSNKQDGIQADYNLLDAVITGNTCYNNSRTGIYIGKTVANLSVTGNTVFGTRAGPLPGPGGTGINVEPHASVVVRGNFVFDNAGEPIALQVSVLTRTSPSVAQ
jgi:parallel beta-helix repeat protein